MSELPFERGGWRPGGPLFGCGVGRRRGTEGGGIKEVFSGAERVGGFCAWGSEGGVRDGGWDLVPEFWPLRPAGCWLVVPFIICGAIGFVAALRMSLVSGSRFRAGTARTGLGAFDTEAFGVVGELSSSISIAGGVEGRPSCFAGRSSEAEASGASGRESGGAEGRSGVQLRGG